MGFFKQRIAGLRCIQCLVTGVGSREAGPDSGLRNKITLGLLLDLGRDEQSIGGLQRVLLGE